MIDKLWGWILGLIGKGLAAVINWGVAGPLQMVLSAYSTTGSLRDFFGQPWAQYLLTYSMALGGTLLGVRVAYEALTTYMLRSSGQPADVTGLVIRTAEAAAMVAGGPWFARELLQWGNTLAADVSHAPFGIGSLADTSTDIGAVMSAWLTTGGLTIIMGVVLVGLLLLIYLQALIRSVEMLVAGVLAPVMAVGQLSPGGGTAAVWLREALVLATSQAVQGTMLYLMAWLLLSPWAQGGSLTGPFFAVAAAWVAFRTPTILRQYAYHTGVGSGAASVVQSASQAVVRTVLAKLPA